MTRSLAQKQASARTLLSNACGQGLAKDAAIDFAVAAMGEEHRKLVEKVWRDSFTYYGPC